MHTEPHSTQNTIPQIGDLLLRLCGTIVVVERVSPRGMVLRTRILHMPKGSRVEAGATMRVPTELIGVTWQVLA
jgi:hypothetical protein